jgi:hypothetical protein
MLAFRGTIWIVPISVNNVQLVAMDVVATLILVILAMLITISGIVLMMIAYHVLDPVVQHAMEVVPALLAKMDTT